MKGWLIQCYFVLSFLFFALHFQVNCSQFFSYNSAIPTSPSCPYDQNSALLQFNNSFSSACLLYSPEFKAKTIGWRKGTNCCLWDGVKCDTETGNVVGLDLSCSCLHGRINANSSLILLHHLNELNLAYNHFSMSPLASEFGQFASLTHLNISNSRFSGTTPLTISHLAKLLSLDLSYNYDLIFEGHVFEKVVGNLTQLRDLLLTGVNMSLVDTTGKPKWLVRMVRRVRNKILRTLKKKSSRKMKLVKRDMADR